MLPINAANISQAYQQAAALLNAGQFEAARTRFVSLEKLAPQLAEIPYQLGRIALSCNAPAEARDHLQRALAIKPKEPAIATALAQALAALGDTDHAIQLYDQLIAAAPKSIKLRADKALILQRIGDFAGAERAFRHALKLSPKNGELYRMLVATKKLTKGDPLIRAMRKAWADNTVAGRSRIQLGFALAKAMEDSGQTARVFPYLTAANAAHRAAQPYDIADRKAEVAGLIAAFQGADFTPSGPGPVGFAPIIVTGLPRSGTTLVERILAAHPDVTAGGEMRHGLAQAYETMGHPGSFTPLAAIAPKAVAGFGTCYEAALRRQHQFGRFVTDKSIQSHLILGLLAKAVPEARLIVVRRDPRDIGLSIFKNLFADGTHLYANSLEDIAAYIATFDRMIDFWRVAIPGRFTEIAYEDLVADPDRQSRALVAAAGLDWDDACARFYERTDRVETLSIAQVRQPIHQRSTRGWAQYSEEIAPLVAALKGEGVLLDGT